MSANDNCKTCGLWKPCYRGVGECCREGRHNSPFWVEGPGDRKLLTLADFGCREHQPIAETDKDTI